MKVRLMTNRDFLFWGRLEDGRTVECIATLSRAMFDLHKGRHRARWMDPSQSRLGAAALEIGIRGVRHVA